MSTPGIPKPKITFGAAKVNAAKGTNTSKKASTGALNAGVQRTSIFTRPLGGSSRGAGWVAGQRTNQQDLTSAVTIRNWGVHLQNNFSGINMRQIAEGGAYGSMAGIGMSGMGGMGTSGNAMIGAMMGIQMAKGVFGMLNQYGVIGNKSGPQPGATLPDKTGDLAATLTSSSGGIDTAVINGMTSAKDSVALTTAINEAKVRQSELPDSIDTAKGELEKLKGESGKLKEASDKATENYNNHLGELKTANETKNKAQQAVNGAQQKFDSAKLTYSNSVTAYQSAQAALNSTPETINGPNGTQIHNPAYDTAKQAVEKAKAEMDKALKQMNDAQDVLDGANLDLEEAQQALDKLNDQTEDLKNKQAGAKENYKKNLDDIKAKQAEIEQLNKEKEMLDKEIQRQEKALTKMQKDESSEYNKVSDQILKLREKQERLMNQVNPSDDNGLSKKENRKNDRDSALDAQIAALEQRQAELKPLVDAHPSA